MKKFNLVLATLGLVFIFTACAPEEEVHPQIDPQETEKFDVKSTDGDGGSPKPKGS